MSQQLTFLSIFLPCKKCPIYVTPCCHWPWIFVICWCIMVSPDPPLHSLTHRCLHYWTGPGKLDSAGKSLILLPVIPTFVFLHHSWHTNCPLPTPRPALLLPWTTEGRSVRSTSVGHRTLHMNQKMQITYFPNAVVPSVFLHPPAYFASSLWLTGGNGALQDIQHMNQKIFTDQGSRHWHRINKN